MKSFSAVDTVDFLSSFNLFFRFCADATKLIISFCSLWCRVNFILLDKKYAKLSTLITAYNPTVTGQNALLIGTPTFEIFPLLPFCLTYFPGADPLLLFILFFHFGLTVV